MYDFDITQFNVNNLGAWIELARYLLTLTSIIISIVLAVKKRKIKFSELLNNLLSWIEEAETHKAWTGAEKKDFVVNRAFQYCYSNHIAYDADKISDQIERQLAFSNSVNVNGKIGKAETIQPQFN